MVEGAPLATEPELQGQVRYRRLASPGDSGRTAAWRGRVDCGASTGRKIAPAPSRNVRSNSCRQMTSGTTEPGTDAVDPWDAAQSLAHLAEATVDFLEGRLQATPSHGGPPHSETADLVPHLARLNRAGLVTIGSQPGFSDQGAGSAQRAYVESLCTAETVARIQTALLYDDLVVITFAPGEDSFCSIPVTIYDHAPFTWLGRWSPEEIDVYRNGDAELDAALDAAWAVQVFDPVWGRNDWLWTTLNTALGV